MVSQLPLPKLLGEGQGSLASFTHPQPSDRHVFSTYYVHRHSAQCETSSTWSPGQVVDPSALGVPSGKWRREKPLAALLCGPPEMRQHRVPVGLCSQRPGFKTCLCHPLRGLRPATSLPHISVSSSGKWDGKSAAARGFCEG